MVGSFVAGVDAALASSGSGADAFVALFFVGVALVVAAPVLAVVGLVRGGSKVLSSITLVVALLPLIAVLALFLINRV